MLIFIEARDHPPLPPQVDPQGAEIRVSYGISSGLQSEGPIATPRLVKAALLASGDWRQFLVMNMFFVL